jgi:hypothetical protein
VQNATLIARSAARRQSHAGGVIVFALDCHG